MKQKTNITPVTKVELTKILKNYPTKEEVDAAFKKSEEGIRQSFDKKIADRLIASENAFRVEIDHKFELMMDKFDEKFSKFTNLILTAIDPLIKDLETRREDRELAAAEMRDFKRRLTKLENS